MSTGSSDGPPAASGGKTTGLASPTENAFDGSPDTQPEIDPPILNRFYDDDAASANPPDEARRLTEQTGSPQTDGELGFDGSDATTVIPPAEARRLAEQTVSESVPGNCTRKGVPCHLRGCSQLVRIPCYFLELDSEFLPLASNYQ